MAFISASTLVGLRIISVADKQESRRDVAAELYLKGDNIYLRYPEADMGQTTTTVKIGTRQVKILRHGEVSSEQVFVPEAATTGYYQTPQGRIRLEIQTRELDVRLTEGLGTVKWSYDLYFDGNHAGEFKLALETARLAVP